jgi:tetratricopeptide (TPR) repeat protein
MLETIREYAFERLEESDEVESVQSQFMSFFLTLSRRAEQEISGPSQLEWLGRMDLEHENLRAALAWKAEQPELAVSQLNLALALCRFWLVRGYWDEGLTCLLRVLSPAAVLPLAAERSRAFNSCGHFACQLARYDAALHHYEQSLAIRRSLGDERGTAATLNNLGLVHRHQANYDKARPLFYDALELFRKLGQERAVATCLSNLASVHSAHGDYAAADQSAREAIQIFRSIGDQLGVAASLTELANLAMCQGQIDRAKSFFEESLVLARGLGEKVGIVGSLQRLGEIMVGQGDFEAARVLYEESLEIARDLVGAPYLAIAKEALEKLRDMPVGVL